MKKILLLITFVACINPPEKPDPQIDVALAQKAYKDLSEEVDTSLYYLYKGTCETY